MMRILRKTCLMVYEEKRQMRGRMSRVGTAVSRVSTAVGRTSYVVVREEESLLTWQGYPTMSRAFYSNYGHRHTKRLTWTDF